MDIEQLKLILETIKSLGQTAGWATVAVFGVPYLISLLQTLAWVSGGVALALVARSAYVHHRESAVAAINAQTSAKIRSDPNEMEKTRQAELALETAKIKATGDHAMRDLYSLCIALGMKPSSVHWVGSADYDAALKRARQLNATNPIKEAA